MTFGRIRPVSLEPARTMLTRPSKCLPGCPRKQACSFGHHPHFARSVASMARPVRLVHLALDARAQISAFVKLKLRMCARPEPRAGFFAWCRDALKFPGSAENKDTFSSLASFAWLRVPSALMRQFRIVVYNAASPGAMRFCWVVGLSGA